MFLLSATFFSLFTFGCGFVVEFFRDSKEADSGITHRHYTHELGTIVIE